MMSKYIVWEPRQAQVKKSRIDIGKKKSSSGYDEEPEHFGEDALPQPPGVQRIAKSQRLSNSTASSGSNPAMFQEMTQQQYELDRKAKIKVIEREANSRINLYNSQKIFEDMRVLQIDTRGMDPVDVASINAQKARVPLFGYDTRSMARGQAQVKKSRIDIGKKKSSSGYDEEPGHFGEDVLPQPPGVQRIAKSQRLSNSTASSGSNPAMFQEMTQQQYELDRKAKIKHFLAMTPEVWHEDS
nr:hypothetical protein [Tanacetum cinerariifolium]